jgi:hypothetical protein
VSDDGARRVSPDLRARVLIYFVSGWSPRDALIHLYCQGVRMTRADYLSVIRAYCDSQDETRAMGRSSSAPS